MSCWAKHPPFNLSAPWKAMGLKSLGHSSKPWGSRGVWEHCLVCRYLSGVTGRVASRFCGLCLFCHFFFFLPVRGRVNGSIPFPMFPAVRILLWINSCISLDVNSSGTTQQSFGSGSEYFQDILKPDAKFLISLFLSCGTCC